MAKVQALPPLIGVGDQNVYRFLAAVNDNINTANSAGDDGFVRRGELGALAKQYLSGQSNTTTQTVIRTSSGGSSASPAPFMAINKEVLSAVRNDLYIVVVGNCSPLTPVMMSVNSAAASQAAVTNRSGLAVISGYVNDLGYDEGDYSLVFTCGTAVFDPVKVRVEGTPIGKGPWITYSNTTLSLVTNDPYTVVMGNLDVGEDVSLYLDGELAGKAGVANDYGMLVYVGTSQGIGRQEGEYTVQLVPANPAHHFDPFNITLTGVAITGPYLSTSRTEMTASQVNPYVAGVFNCKPYAPIYYAEYGHGAAFYGLTNKYGTAMVIGQFGANQYPANTSVTIMIQVGDGADAFVDYITFRFT